MKVLIYIHGSLSYGGANEKHKVTFKERPNVREVVRYAVELIMDSQRSISVYNGSVLVIVGRSVVRPDLWDDTILSDGDVCLLALPLQGG